MSEPSALKDALVTKMTALSLAEETSSPEVRHLERFVPYLMNRVMARYNHSVETALRPSRISVPQMRALAVLAQDGPRTVNELAALTVTKQSTMSRTLDLMEDAGLVRRTADRDDNRIRRVHLTEIGLLAFDRSWPQVEVIAGRMVATLSADEREAMAAMLVRILHDIRHHDY